MHLPRPPKLLILIRQERQEQHPMPYYFQGRLEVEYLDRSLLHQKQDLSPFD
ncbi:hypothetical protein HMPREF1619_00379 [Klebsiella pneumoniae 909957]|nr:hypothetical protein HMPREF1619_00379 [Klebsiella pneumoniae 909957]